MKLWIPVTVSLLVAGVSIAQEVKQHPDDKCPPGFVTENRTRTIQLNGDIFVASGEITETRTRKVCAPIKPEPVPAELEAPKSNSSEEED